MRTIYASEISNAVKSLYLDLNCSPSSDITTALQNGLETESSPTGKYILSQILENNKISAAEKLCMCQDTGMAVLFIELGQEIQIIGNFEDAVNQGVREAYLEGYLRKSIVSDPVYDRKNTKDNTPAIIHLRIKDGDHILINAAAKGFGSENMSQLKMMVPADGESGVLSFILKTVEEAGPNPCPPIIVGVGIGGDMEYAAELAKRATLRPVDQHNTDCKYKRLEEEALRQINMLGIGPGGLGGNITALGVNIEFAPTHIASMPVAVNICCHAARHKSVLL